MDALSDGEREALKSVGLSSALDVLSETPESLACRLQIPDAQALYDRLAQALAPPAQTADVYSPNDFHSVISTGDIDLDKLLGGGITTGAVWEVTGEGSSGKTQLALQLTLRAVLSHPTSSLSPSVCYLGTRSSFPTERLLEMYRNRPQPPSLNPDTLLERIQFRQVQTSSELMRIVDTALPNLAEARKTSSSPLRLVVIDTLSPLVAIEGTSTAALNRERKHLLNELGSSLTFLAQRFGLAVLVVNEVTDIFMRDGSDRGSKTSTSASTQRASSQMLNRTSRWSSKDPYSRPATAALAWETQAERIARTPQRLVEIGAIEPGDRKEAKLGFGWSYRVHARIMLSRTDRMWIGAPPSNVPAHGPPAAKKRRIHTPASVSIPIAKRNLFVLFNKYGPRGSVDFVLRPSGLETLPDTLWIDGTAQTKTKTTQNSERLDHSNPNSHRHIPSSAPARVGGLPHSPTSPVSQHDHSSRAVSWPQRNREATAGRTNGGIEPSPIPNHENDAPPVPSSPRGEALAAPDMVDWEFYFADGDDFTDRLSEPDSGVELLGHGPGLQEQESDERLETEADVDNADAEVGAEEEDNPGSDMYDDVDLELDAFFEDEDLLDLDLDYAVGNGHDDLGQDDLSLGANESESRLSPALSIAETVSADGDRGPAGDAQGSKVDIHTEIETARDGLLTRTPSLTSARLLPH